MSVVNAGVGMSNLNSGFGDTPTSRRLNVLIDKVATAMQLSNKFRAELHVFKEFVLDIDPMHWRVTVVQQASIYKSLDQQEEILKAIAEVKEDGKQVQSQIAKRFAVDKDMNDDILALCKQLVVEGLRDEYDLADEAVEALKDRAKYPRFAQVWNSASKTKLVVSAVRTQGSYVRREYRGLLVNSTVNPMRKGGLTVCVRENVRKFSRTADITPELVIWVAVLRQFIRDNRDLVSLNDDVDGVVPDVDDTAQQPQANGRKRKRAGGRPARSFWGEFTEWVKDKKREDEWTSDFRSAGWVAHIEDCLAQERRDFPDDRLALVPQRFQPTSQSQVEVPPTSQPGADTGLGLASSGISNFSLHSSVQLRAQPPQTGDAGGFDPVEHSNSPGLPPMRTHASSSRSTPLSWTSSPNYSAQVPLPADEVSNAGSVGTPPPSSYTSRVQPQHDRSPGASSSLRCSLPRSSVGDSSHGRLEELAPSSRFSASESRAQLPGLPGISTFMTEVPDAQLGSLATSSRSSASFVPPPAHFHGSISTPEPRRSDRSQHGSLSQFGGHAVNHESSPTSGPRGPSLHGTFQSWSGASMYGR